ncbi:hypothetical protein [Nonomuraea sp. LPB2021202275-12-8]|uniref:hypothetical protein n=1 Tax=Nonomuraea sp. LPB2021202275-12-8 TaxID=3120159 RepID=UPI00300D00F3
MWDALSTQIVDGTRIAKAGATSEGAIVGGAKIAFHSMAESDGDPVRLMTRGISLSCRELKRYVEAVRGGRLPRLGAHDPARDTDHE